MSDEDSPIIDKLYSTPESKEKTRSKFKNLLDDIELKLQKPKKNTTNSNLETNSNTSSNTNKPEKNKEKNINVNNNSKPIKNFNSFEKGQIKKGENKKKTYTKIKNNNNSLLQRINKEKDKFKEKDEIRQRNSITALNSINFNLSNNKNNINKKLRPSTPGLRKKEEEDNKNNEKNGEINNKTNKKEKKEVIDPLYIPHIVKDPLDILKHKVDIILEKSNEEITNISNKISLIDIEMESEFAKEHENYSKNLEIIYKEKEKKLRETYKKYDFALYKMFKTYGQKNNVIYDEMMKDKVDQILEIEQEFNNKKNKTKNNFNEKIEDIKKIYEKKRQEQDIINKELISDIKKKLYNILYDKNIQNNKNENNNNEDGNKKMKKTKSFFTLKK